MLRLLSPFFRPTVRISPLMWTNLPYFCPFPLINNVLDDRPHQGGGEWWPPWVQRSAAIKTPSPHSIMHCTPLNHKGCIFCTMVSILHRGVYSAQVCAFYTGLCISHRDVYSAQGFVFCTRVYFLHTVVYSAQGCIFYTHHFLLMAGRAFTLLPMCNNCSGRNFGQEQHSDHAQPIHLFPETLSILHCGKKFRKPVSF